MKNILIRLLPLFFLSFAFAQAEDFIINNDEQFVLKESKNDLKQTLQKAKDFIASKGLKLFYIVDHAAAAKEAKKNLEPTQVLIFGNPAAGADKMTATPNLAVQLPLKLLIYERKGKTFVGFVRPTSFAIPFKLSANDAFLNNTEKLLQDLSDAIRN
ncbi:hypothetical protein CCZ01_08200 [Helicobacter monodelphidis]|uniref:DUF302 domain-containing protein n=1 Tax=Helicobacter sp. 15-1451 TaxID=2004995 RepID=UPI000DCCAFB7|nr:DUF302 domain-containing protein [Helicobacter sp. 15-1451]RAX56829.1 hypothetical protein CCZ01_08200 [Helicobacter sp. 15-1451]